MTRVHKPIARVRAMLRPASAPLPRPRYDCSVVGSEAVGKSALLQRGCWNQFSKAYAPTVGTEYYSMLRAGCQLSFWEAGGQQRYAQVHVQSLRRAQALIYVFDASSDDSLREVIERARALDAVAERVHVRLLVAAKIDCCRDGRPAVDAATLDAARRTLGVDGYFETSAANGRNVARVFQTLIDRLTQSNVEPAAIRHMDLPAEIVDEPKFDWRRFVEHYLCLATCRG